MPRAWRTVVLVAAVGLSAALLFAPSPEGGSTVPHVDKVVHAGIFAGLTVAAWWRYGTRSWLLVPLLAYAVASEVLQGAALPTRSGDPVDLVADCVGVAAGWVLGRRVARAR